MHLNFCKIIFPYYNDSAFQKAKKLGKFGGKLTKFEDIGVDLNKVCTNIIFCLHLKNKCQKGTCVLTLKVAFGSKGYATD